MGARVRIVYGSPRRYQQWKDGGWQDISESEFNDLAPTKPIDYTKGEMPGLHPDYHDWCRENGGQGRYCPQAARFPGDPRARFPDRQSFIDWGKKQGFGIEAE